MKRALKYLILASLAAAAVWGGYAYYRKSRILVVQTVSPRRGSITVFVEETGRIRLSRWQTVCAATQGMAGEVLVEVGDRVAPGQTIVEMDDAQLVERIAQARATIAEIAAIELERARHRITSPFAGIVLEKMVRGSVWLAPGTPVVKIGDPETVEAEVDILTDDLHRLSHSGEAVVYGRALAGREIEAKVIRVHPEAFTRLSSLGIEQQRVKVVLSLAGGSAGLLPGMSVEVKIRSTRADGALLVPEKSVFSRKGSHCVFGLDSGRLGIRKITKGLSDGESVQVLGGVSESDVLVLSPDNDMEEGAEAEAAAADGRD